MGEQVTDGQKLMVLCLLVLQNASVVIMGRYSRGVLKESYLGSTVVIMTEVTKMIISVFCIQRAMGNSYLNSKPWSLPSKCWYLIQNSGYTWVPATCYFVQNTLQYTALENLSSAVYAVMAQMKILTAALFAVILLRKKLMVRKWRALILLVVGGVLMENHTFEIHERNDTLSTNTSDPVKGTFAILAIVALSGVAGVATQWLLQGKPQNGTEAQPPQMSLWDRNFQMAFWSILFGGVTLFWDRAFIIENGGFFGGWTMNTWILVFLWAIGGILVALCIKYTDVIIKGFASAISLILISLVGWMLLGDTLDLIFILGAVITIVATFNYNEDDPPQPQTVAKPEINDTEEMEMVSNKKLEDPRATIDIIGESVEANRPKSPHHNHTPVDRSPVSNVHSNITQHDKNTALDTEKRGLLRNTDD